MGDLCSIMPVVQPYAGGATGTPHGNNYKISDPIAACVDSAKMQLGMLLLLLENGGKRALKIINEYEAQFKSKEEYFRYVDNMCCSGDRIDYSNSDNVTVNLK